MSAFASPDIEIDRARAADMVAAGAAFIDVRETYERDAGFIDGSEHIELERLASKAEEIDRDRAVVFYCRLGARSAMAASAFRAAGYDAYTMGGGIMAWVAEGRPISPPDGYVADH